MRTPWTDLVVVLTGATSGIGRATALELAHRGCTVTALGRRDDALQDLAVASRSMIGTIEPWAADVDDGTQLRRLADEVVARHGRIDVWINNAAVNLYGPFEAAPLEDVRRVLDTNLGGVAAGCHAAIPHLRERGTGTLVNVASVLGQVPAPYQAAYVATKHAIHGLTGSLRQELADTGIAVCEVEPGPVDTPLFGTAGNYMGREVVPLDPIASPERIAAAILATIERPRAVRVVGVANAALVLASRLAPRLTERAAGAVTRRQHFTDEPAEATSGNLHRPAEDQATTAGGWRERAAGRRHELEAVGATVALLGGFLALRRGGRR